MHTPCAQVYVQCLVNPIINPSINSYFRIPEVMGPGENFLKNDISSSFGDLEEKNKALDCRIVRTDRKSKALLVVEKLKERK